MSELKTLQERVEKLENRNRRVENDKGWETSWTRKLGIMGLTYIVVVVYLAVVVESTKPFIDGLVPVMGFFLSTLTLSALKTYWISRQ
jgi:peptidoglycan/LPS O-acetylase OafA/YrhL